MNRKYIGSIAALALLCVNVQAQQWPTPNPEAKPGTRWWWLGSAVTPSDTKWNLSEYGKTGIGAVEITPIYGVQGNDANNIKYLSPEWMKALRDVQAEAAKNGIQVDMNCGTGWPFGGPETPIEEAAAKMIYEDTTVTGKQLREGIDISVKNPKETKYAILQRVMAYPIVDNLDKIDNVDIIGEVNAIDLTSKSTDGKLLWKKADKKTSYRILAIYCSRTRQQVKRAAPGGEGLVIDHYNKEAVAHYLEKFEKAFESTGTPYPHTFFNDSYEVYGANWTPLMFEEFEARRGYKLENHLFELLGWTDDKNKVLADYRETLSDLLLENFSQQWTEWAHKHGVKTRNQAHGSPANLIDVYSSVDIPEIEGFGLSEFGIKGLRTDPGMTKKNDSDVSMLKYASSAAHVNGKPFASSETFTWLTEHFRTSLSQCKPDLDLMFSCGVNNIYFHGSCYTPEHDVWPGWKFYASVDMSPTNSIWHDAPYFMRYIERCQSFLQMGQPDNDFLVLLPVRDMWQQRKGSGAGSIYMMFAIHDMAKKAPDFIKSVLDIDKAGFDCDYISERLLLTTIYNKGMLQTAAGTRYSALVIPGNPENIPENVKKHIAELQQQGAKVVYGTSADDLRKCAKPEALRSELSLRTLRRTNDTGHHYFMANLTPNDVNQRVKLAIEDGAAIWFNPLNGERYMADINAEGLAVDLRSGESMILQTFNGPMPMLDLPAKPGSTISSMSTSSTMSKISKNLENHWTLTFINSAPKVEKAWELDKLQTWESLDDDSVKVTMGTGRYATHVTMTAEEAAKSWRIILGDVRESARVRVNGEEIGCAWSVPFELNLGKVFKKGNNLIEIDVTNLPANRIAHLDRIGYKWRKFNEINVVDLNYKKNTYENWEPMPSGLNSEVLLVEM